MLFGKVDVTEGQLCVVSMMLASAVLGPGIWDVSFFGLFSFRVVPTLFATGCGAFALYNILSIISQGGAGRNGSTVAVRI